MDFFKLFLGIIMTSTCACHYPTEDVINNCRNDKSNCPKIFATLICYENCKNQNEDTFEIQTREIRIGDHVCVITTRRSNWWPKRFEGIFTCPTLDQITG